LNEASGYLIPDGLVRHRGLIPGLVQPFREALVYREISSSHARLAPQWLEQSPRLLDEPEIRGWLVHNEAVQGLTADWRRASGRSAVVSPVRQEQLLDRAVREALTPELRVALRRRLEEVACWFLHQRRRRQAEQAVAAAVAIEHASTSRLVVPGGAPRIEGHPFLRALMRRSLDVSVYAEESGDEEDRASLRLSPFDPPLP
jgi:hypothetical protein